MPAVAHLIAGCARGADALQRAGMKAARALAQVEKKLAQALAVYP